MIIYKDTKVSYCILRTTAGVKRHVVPWASRMHGSLALPRRSWSGRTGAPCLSARRRARAARTAGAPEEDEQHQQGAADSQPPAEP
jgi:hypothetical protein